MNEELTILKRMFCCGVPHNEFEEHFNSLTNSEQQRLIRVAARFQVTYVIRYDLSFFKQPGMGEGYEFRIQDIELTSLEIYLLLTCLDTLAGKAEYFQFDQWVKNRLEEKLYQKDEIVAFYKEYRKDYGPRSTLRQEFLDLPDAHKQWIYQNVSILRADEFPDEKIRQQNEDYLLSRLFIYFYDIRRNEYTHASKTRQTYVDRNPVEEFAGWSQAWSLSASGYEYAPDREKPNRTFRFWYRPGLDEATILRVIIHGIVLRKLGLDSNECIIAAYLMNEYRRMVITELIHEIKRNAANVSWWELDDLDKNTGNLPTILINYGIPKLEKRWAESFVKVTLDVNLERGLKDRIERYLKTIEFINSMIDEFNEHYSEKDESCEEKAVSSIHSFLSDLTQTEHYKLVVEESWHRTIGNLMLIRRDPCYKG